MDEIYQSTNFSCTHIKLKIEHRICCKCGGIYFNNEEYSIKPNKFKISSEVDYDDILQNLKNNTEIQMAGKKNFQPFNFNNATISEYEKKRNKIIKQLKTFVDKYKFKSKSLHLAVFLIDQMIYKFRNNTNKNKVFVFPIESIGVGCLIISSKILNLN